MRIALLTQDDPFYLAEAIAEFTELVKENDIEFVTAIVSSASPFGKRESFLDKALKTYNIFGLVFFLRYTFNFILRKFILRKSVIKELENRRIPVWQLRDSINIEKNVAKIAKMNLDAIIIIAGNQIIKSDVLGLPKFGVINAHSSLLPKHKGLMPTFWALKNRDDVTGVTVFFLTEGIDDGPIINQGKIKINQDTTQQDLIIESKEMANKLLIDALNSLKNGTVDRKPNIGDDSYNRFPTREDVDCFLKQGNKFF